MGSRFGTVPTTSASPVLDVVPTTIVVPVDGSDLSLRAAPVASWLAEHFDASVYALTAAATHEGHDGTGTPPWLEALATDARYPRLRAAVAETDDPVVAVSAFVAAHPDSAVCMATHSQGALTAAALGSVAARVVREVGVPVLLVGGQCVAPRDDTGPMVVCHDGSPGADAILAPARAWARGLDVPIVLAHVHHPLDFGTPQRSTDAIEAALEFLGAGTCLETVADPFAAGAIRELAHELDASLIALNTHSRPDSSDVAMGSVASWVTRESPVPVLTIRPSVTNG